MKEKPPWYYPNKLMADQGLDYYTCQRWRIWAAKDRQCPKCQQPPYKPCLNMVDLQHGRQKTRKNAQWPPRRTAGPHSERVDWNKLETALRWGVT